MATYEPSDHWRRVKALLRGYDPDHDVYVVWENADWSLLKLRPVKKHGTKGKVMQCVDFAAYQAASGPAASVSSCAMPASPAEAAQAAIEGTGSQQVLGNDRAQSQQVTAAAASGNSFRNGQGCATCPEMVEVLVRGHKHCMLSGVAGSGKTATMLRDVLPQLLREYGKRSLWITASTGIAAQGINGTTLHSKAGLGLGQGDVHELIERMNAVSTVQTCHFSMIKVVCTETSMTVLRCDMYVGKWFKSCCE